MTTGIRANDEAFRQTTDDTVSDELRPVVERLVEATNPDRILLFGSRGRGDHRADSDYDVYVLVPETRPFAGRPPFWLWHRVKESGLPIDVFMMSSSVFERRRLCFNSLEEAASRDGKVLFDRRAGA